MTLDVFDTTTDRSAVHITGMTVIARHEESLLRLEVLLQVQNDTRPQATVVGTPGSFGLALPAALTDVAAEYHRGPAAHPRPRLPRRQPAGAGDAPGQRCQQRCA